MLGALNEGLFEGGVLTNAERSGVNIQFKGGIKAANKKYDELLQKLGVSPALSRSFETGSSGRSTKLAEGYTINVRPISSAMPDRPNGYPTVEIIIKVNKTKIKMRF